MKLFFSAVAVSAIFACPVDALAHSEAKNSISVFDLYKNRNLDDGKVVRVKGRIEDVGFYLTLSQGCPSDSHETVQITGNVLPDHPESLWISAVGLRGFAKIRKKLRNISQNPKIKITNDWEIVIVEGVFRDQKRPLHWISNRTMSTSIESDDYYGMGPLERVRLIKRFPAECTADRTGMR